jgi:hypothetical protein
MHARLTKRTAGSGVCPKQGLSLSSQTSRRGGAEEPSGAVGASCHAASLGPDATQMEQAQRGGRQAAGEAGLAVLDRWCTHSPSRWKEFLLLDGVALGADLDWGLLQGSWGHCTLCNGPGLVRTSDVQAPEGGSVLTGSGGASDNVDGAPGECVTGSVWMDTRLTCAGVCCSGGEPALTACWRLCIAAAVRRSVCAGGGCPQVKLRRVRKKWMVPV